ncbi:MAG: hypothetical protein PVJ66_07550 [Gammaproteobacteria bacterium]|jgi:hypothetical protein
MAISLPATVILSCALLCLSGCAATGGTDALTSNTASEGIPAADPAFDHYIAWIPREQAPTTTIAKTLTHIRLGRAKERAASQVCGGAGLLDGRVTDLVGPLPAIAPPARGGYPAWYYRISHQPGLRGCTAVTAEELYRALETYLPGWISIRAAARPAGTGISRLE